MIYLIQDEGEGIKIITRKKLNNIKKLGRIKYGRNCLILFGFLEPSSVLLAFPQHSELTGRPIIELFAVSISGQARVLTGLLTSPPGRVQPVLTYTVNIAVASGERNKTKLLLMWISLLLAFRATQIVKSKFNLQYITTASHISLTLDLVLKI